MLLVGLKAARARMLCPLEMPPKMPPAWLLAKPLAARRSFLDDREAVADCHALDGVDAHQGFGDVGVKAVEDGFAEAGGDVFGDDGDFCADAVAIAADVGEVAVEQRGLVIVRAVKRVFADVFPVREVEAVFADLRDVAADAGAGEVGEDLFGDCAAGDADGGFARRCASAAAVVADAVFGVVGVVGVAGAVLVFDGAVVAAALVFVVDEQADGRAGGLACKDAGEEAEAVVFLARGNVARGAGFAPVEFGLDGGFVQRDARRSAIENAADGRAVAFAVGGEDEVLSDAVSAHGWVPCLGALVFIFVFVCCARQRNSGGDGAVGNAQGEVEPKQR